VVKMICPKWRECKSQGALCYKTRPHKKEDTCEQSTANCPQCIFLENEEDVLFGATNR
jgi:hypothetical protein